MNALTNLMKITFKIYHNNNTTIDSDFIHVTKVRAEDIVMEVWDDNNAVMHNVITRIPSAKNPMNANSLPAGYEMMDLMHKSETLVSAAKAMGIDKPVYKCSGPRKNLTNSDLYFLRLVELKEFAQNQRYEYLATDQVYRSVQSLMRDPHPVIIVSVQNGTRWACPGTVEDRISMLMKSGFQPCRKNSEWYYLTR